MRTIGLAMFVVFLCTASAWAQGPPPAKVVVTKVTQEETAENQSVIGILYYDRVSQVSTEVAGLVERVNIAAGDLVKKGDPLMTLNTELLDIEISLARTRIKQIELRIQNTRKNYERLAKIFMDQGISEKDYDDALYTFQDAEKEKQATEDSLKRLLLQKKKSVIKAPFNGRILSKDVDTGGWVQQGKQLVSIGSTRDLYVRAPIAETLLQYMEIGESVVVTINAFKKELRGKVVDIDPVADMKTKNIFVKIAIPPMPLVAENMSATVFVPTGPKRKLSILTRASLVKHQGKDFVYTIKDGKASILPVNIVAYMGEKIGVDNPYIQPGMMVVTEGNERLRPDQPVSVAGEE